MAGSLNVAGKGLFGGEKNVSSKIRLAILKEII